MKKFIRFLTSGTLLVFLFLIIEVLVVLALDLNIEEYIVQYLISAGKITTEVGAAIVTYVTLGVILIRIIFTIISIILFFKIINKWEDPEFKIPWLIFLFVIPIVTCTFYLIFADHGLPRREKKVMKEYYQRINPFLDHNEKNNLSYSHELDDAYGVFNYIASTAKMGIHRDNRITYYKNGEAFFPAFIEGLKKAEKFIFIEFFIITDGKEWSEVQEILKQKAQAGVDVRIIYDDMGCGGTISSFTPRRLRKYGIKCYKFHPFRPILSGVFNNRDHRKIVVIDHKMAFTGGINLADEYANLIERFGYWKDTMVKIEGTGISNLIATFMANYGIASKKVPDELEQYINYNYQKFEGEGYVMPFGDGPGGIDNELIGEQNYINILKYAKKKVYISTPYLIPTYQLMDAMRNVAMRGVEVHLIVPGIPDKKLVYLCAKGNFKPLLQAGVKIYTYTPGFNHMKSMLADDELAFVGTINFDFRSLVHHFECGTLVYKSDCIKDIKNDFEEMLSVSKQVPQNFKLNIFARMLCGIVKLISPLL